MRVDEGKPRARTPVTEQPGLDVVGAQRSGQQRILLQVDLPDRQVVAGPPPCVDGGEILLTCWARIRGRGGGFGGRCRGGHACSNGMWVKGKDDPNQCRSHHAGGMSPRSRQVNSLTTLSSNIRELVEGRRTTSWTDCCTPAGGEELGTIASRTCSRASATK